jgi:hypothetical protein
MDRLFRHFASLRAPFTDSNHTPYVFKIASAVLSLLDEEPVFWTDRNDGSGDNHPTAALSRREACSLLPKYRFPVYLDQRIHPEFSPFLATNYFS